MTKALPKAQKEFFNGFVQETVLTILAQICQEDQREQIVAVANVILKSSAEEGNLDHIVNATAESILSKVDFKTLKKVDAFMKNEDFVNVLRATHEAVFGDFKEDYMNLVAAVVEVSEKAIKSAVEEQAI